MALHFTKEEFKNRKSKVLKSMKEQNLNVLLMFKQESMYWLTGYDTFGFVFIGAVTMGGIMTAIIFIYVYLSKRRSKSKQ